MIYVVQVQPCGPLKVGFTNDFETRFAQLQQANPHDLVTVYLWEGPHELEQALLKALPEKWKLRGEWFHPHLEVWNELMEFAKSRDAVRPSPRLTRTQRVALGEIAADGKPKKFFSEQAQEIARELEGMGLVTYLVDEDAFQVTRDGVWVAKGYALT